MQCALCKEETPSHELDNRFREPVCLYCGDKYEEDE